MLRTIFAMSDDTEEVSQGLGIWAFVNLMTFVVVGAAMSKEGQPEPETTDLIQNYLLAATGIRAAYMVPLSRRDKKYRQKKAETDRIHEYKTEAAQLVKLLKQIETTEIAEAVEAVAPNNAKKYTFIYDIPEFQKS